MSKDQIYGGLIFAIALIVAIGYITAFFAPYLNLPSWWRDWAIALPIFIIVLAVLGIFMWIGWVMFTTPPPQPIEVEEEKEGEKEKTGEETKNE
jgi:predicted DNA-binding transcriptional regulator